MQRYKCTIAYDGTLFSGYQVQPGKRTVQSELEGALAKLHKGEQVKVYASGRTDAGVHAKGQVIHFESPLAISIEKWGRALNSLLPSDISIISTETVSPGFHARFDAERKEYRYFVQITENKDPFMRFYAYHFPYKVQIEPIQEALEALVGTHDFTSFCSAKTEIEDRIRTIETAEVYKEKDLLVFRLVGNGFLYNMVRIIVGTMLEVGTGERTPISVQDIIEKKNRIFAGKTAPGHGLYLWKVDYQG